jgi:hypothetical protein
MTKWRLNGPVVMELIRNYQQTTPGRGVLVDDTGVIMAKKGFMPYPTWVDDDGLRLDFQWFDLEWQLGRATNGPVWYTVYINIHGAESPLATIFISSHDLGPEEWVHIRTDKPLEREPVFEWPRLPNYAAQNTL